MNIWRKLNGPVQCTVYTLATNRLPAGHPGLHILQVSDLQSERFGAGQSELLRLAAQAKPDLILITGDLADRRHTDYRASLEAAAGLAALGPVCYVNGNHEADLRTREAESFYEKLSALGIRVLRDRSALLPVGRPPVPVRVMGLAEETVFRARGQEPGTGSRVEHRGFHPEIITGQIDRMAGRSDGPAEDAGEVPGEKPNGFPDALPAERLAILLAHEPQLLPFYARPGVDLIFSGHAHGGQFRLPGGQGLYAPEQGILPRLTQGLHRAGDAHMVVSRGLGNSTFPLRLHNRPELVLLRLRPEKR